MNDLHMYNNKMTRHFILYVCEEESSIMDKGFPLFSLRALGLHFTAPVAVHFFFFFAWELVDEMTHCRLPANIIRLCFPLFFFCSFSAVMSLSGVRDVVGTPREDIEYELCAERLSARKKKKKTQQRMRGKGGKKSPR